jgi:hypothetical protein
MSYTTCSPLVYEGLSELENALPAAGQGLGASYVEM